MRIFIYLFFLLSFAYLVAQDATNDDSMMIDMEMDLEIIEKPDPLSFKDSILSVFKVHHKSVLIDSLWRKELYNSDLFEEMQEDILAMDYEEVVYEELSTELLKERLAILDAKTPFNVEYTPALESIIKNYLKNRRTSLQRIMDLSKFYFPMFEQELDAHNLPLEIKYLAIVESALNPRARSRVGATGLWQFMYPTGKMFGMDVSSYVDERSDPLRATNAACKYLSSLYNVFDDWNLALAAYNYGPGNVSKAIRRSGGETNYWNIRHNLPRETAGYVPAFLANMYIFEYAEEHGFNTKKTDLTYFKTDTIHVKQAMSFKQLSELLHIPVEELQFLNPSYKMDVIPYIKGKDYTLRLPISFLGTFVSNEDLIYAYIDAEAESKNNSVIEVGGNAITYRVKSGDFLGKIARQYGVLVSNIKKWNNLKSNNLKVGQRLTIYPSSVQHTTAGPSAIAQNTTNTSGSEKEYIVKPGDTLWAIARKYPGISVDNIKKWNDISGNSLKPGMKLKIFKS